ncbi:MAG TPA: methionine adenosyltransferase, partial [Nitrospiria bacterium]|nr:methionine adenosyltransferase [Nitrospiria bacterium]
MDEILIQEGKGLTAAEMDVEIVERKGLGHPDTICDAVMEQVSVALSREYLERFGTILHYNCDKALLVAGRVERRFGGGKVLEPMRLVIGDRATCEFGKEHLDISKIAVDAAKLWFRENLSRIDPHRHLHYQVELKPGSEELTGLFQRTNGIMGANDTSAAVGYAPLSETERLVLETERHLNSRNFKARFPETGEDVKVMGVRTKGRLALTVSMPILDQYIESEADYFRRKKAVQEAITDHLKNRLETLKESTVSLNTLDRPGTGMAGIYLSVLGTSAEDGDSGEVGRGNQVNGIIPLNRPRSSEAAAGKNPVS